MDQIKNPFSPGAGAPPSELVGRDDVLDQTRILLGRVKQKRSEKSILLTGLRGVGKTVLLNEMKRIALSDRYRTILIEAHKNKSLGVFCWHPTCAGCCTNWIVWPVPETKYAEGLPF